MTLDEFNELDWREQYLCVLEKGVVVGSRKNNYFEMTLYRVDNFYVEFKLQLSDGELYIGVIIHDILLVPYLDQVNIDGLLK